MKELSIEEKARRYDETLERAKDALNAYLQVIFPELKESEDEKIRRALIRFHKSTIDVDGIKGEDILAWLEKQGEQKPVEVEPKFKVKYAGREYNVLEVKDIAGVTFYGIEDEPNHIDYVQAENCERVCGYSIKEKGSPYPTKPAVFSGQKPVECRQETKPNGGIVYEDFNDGDGSYKVNLAYLSKPQVELIENLVDSWQNPANNSVEWSEEDIRNIENIDSVLFYDKDLPEDTCVRLRNWLKSLKQRIGG